MERWEDCRWHKRSFFSTKVEDGTVKTHESRVNRTQISLGHPRAGGCAPGHGHQKQVWMSISRR